VVTTGYDCIIIGGGIAGLQGAIQLGRYKHRILVIDKDEGRSTICRSYHNVLGWPDGVSGAELRRLGRLQAERVGVDFVKGEVISLVQSERGFVVETGGGSERLETATVLLATGLTDRFPNLPGLSGCMGLTVYVCPDCDGYEVSDRRTIVMGSGGVGIGMAQMLLYWTRELIYINHEWDTAPISNEQGQQLQEQGIIYIAGTISKVIAAKDASGKLQGVRLADGRMILGERGFIAFGGNKIHSRLAEQAGAELMENKHVITDPRSKMTRIPGLWAAGDVGVHAEQLTIAMGEGSQAAIWIHKELMRR
jgi:thioredoxin reductase (NADPH)